MEQERKKASTTKTKQTKASVAPKATKSATSKETKTSTPKQATKQATKQAKTSVAKKETKPTTSKATKTSTAKTSNSPKATTPKATKQTKTSVAPKATKPTASKETKTSATKTSTIKKATIPKDTNQAKSNVVKNVDISKEPSEPKNKIETTIEKKEKASDEITSKKTEVNKKYVDISIGRIIAIILIIILIVLNVKLGIHAYKVIKSANAEDYEQQNTDMQTNNLSSEVGYILNKKNQIATNIISQITFKPNAVASIYKQGSFNTETVTNDLKLRLGWAKINDEEKMQVQAEDGKEIVVVEKVLMQRSISKIFGNQIECIDQSFNNTDVKKFSEYCHNAGIITFSNSLYEANVTQIEETEKMAPFIYQEVQKILQYSNKTEVHVKTVFIDVKDGKYILYKDYNQDFEEKLLETSAEELFENIAINQYTGEGTISVEENPALDAIRDELNTYIYTLEKEESTGNYYLSEFNKQ